MRKEINKAIDQLVEQDPPINIQRPLDPTETPVAVISFPEMDWNEAKVELEGGQTPPTEYTVTRMNWYTTTFWVGYIGNATVRALNLSSLANEIDNTLWWHKWLVARGKTGKPEIRQLESKDPPINIQGPKKKAVVSGRRVNVRNVPSITQAFLSDAFPARTPGSIPAQAIEDWLTQNGWDYSDEVVDDIWNYLRSVIGVEVH